MHLTHLLHAADSAASGISFFLSLFLFHTCEPAVPYCCLLFLANRQVRLKLQVQNVALQQGNNEFVSASHR